MQIERDKAQFRPLTIRLETQDELDQLLVIIDQVALNRINHAQHHIQAAIEIRRVMLNLLTDNAE